MCADCSCLSFQPDGFRTVCLTQAQAQAVIGRINFEHTDPNLVSLVYHISWVQKVAFRQLRNVDQAFQALLDSDKRAKTHNVGNCSFDNGAHLIALGDIQPGIGTKSFQAQGDAFSPAFTPRT